jgi:carbonic anhydrase
MGTMRLGLSSLLVAFVLAACQTVDEAPAEGTSWSYEGEKGPERWGDLDPAFALCKSGTKQTPIDLPSDAPAVDPAAGLSFSYAPVPLRVLNNGHTVQVTNDGTSAVSFGGVRYALKQFHFHSPSEHTIGGRSFDMEMHLVHANDDGQLLVVGVLLSKGAASSLLAPVWDAMPASKSESERVVAGAAIDLVAALPNAASSSSGALIRGTRYVHYDGSLTTPPCTEGVNWFVALDAGEISDEQITRYRAATGGNTNRPVQSLNGRSVTGATAQ